MAQKNGLDYPARPDGIRKLFQGVFGKGVARLKRVGIDALKPYLLEAELWPTQLSAAGRSAPDPTPFWSWLMTSCARSR